MHLFFTILFNLIAGTFALTYGVKLMSGGLEQINKRAMEKAIAVFTRNVFSAFLVGTFLTAVVQSSTAVTVITVGLVNSGFMTLPQAVGIIYGANIGTTVTAQVMSFNLARYSLPIIFSGLILKLFARRKSLQGLSSAVCGFGLLFLGLRILNSGVPLIRDNRVAYDLFAAYGRNLAVCVLLGAFTTMLVHSSSATVGITIVLFNNGLISYEAAVALTLGDNIGTCMTAQLASSGMSTAARRAAWAHTLYNIIGVLAVMAFFTPFSRLVRYLTMVLGQDESRLVANTHTFFNLLSAVVFLPITKYYVRLTEWLIPGRK